ncbi:hypothetical protein ADILRU_1143 [Leifsonia rubra CMS 76R]|nr:hypothetical protein ADILRU_1143 [Leifsonia rubra CMS 76R]
MAENNESQRERIAGCADANLSPARYLKQMVSHGKSSFLSDPVALVAEAAFGAIF